VGPGAGLTEIQAIKARGELRDYYLLWAAEAGLLRRLARNPEAAESYRRALALVTSDPERRFLERRLVEVGGGTPHRKLEPDA
jgi:RNA polymerase sigma-70 factor (ECF subfamily)